MAVRSTMAGTVSAVAYFWKSTRTVAQYEPQPKRVGTPRILPERRGTMLEKVSWRTLFIILGVLVALRVLFEFI